MKTWPLSAAVGFALALGVVPAANAQSIDYGSLQKLFDEPVTTSAIGSPQRASEAAVDMTIITADDIKRSGVTDLPTILSRVAGIDVLNWSAGDSDVSVRGYDQAYSPRLLVLINGREVYLDDYGYTSWSSLPVTLNEIRQIEVVRGPNSALFGFNAVGGVINIITFSPKYDNTNSIEVHGGTQNDGGGSAVTTLHLGDRLSMRLSVGGERQDEWSNASTFTTPWNAHTLFDGVAQLAPETELRLEGSWSRSSQNDLISIYNVYSSPTVYTTGSIKGAATSDTPYGEIQAQAYLNDLRYDSTIASFSSATVKNQMEVASLQDLLKVGTRSTVRVALEYRNNRENTTPLDSGVISYGVWAPSAMWNLAATDELSLTAAVRLDSLHLDRTGPYPVGFPLSNSAWNRTTNAFSANLGAVYKPTDFDTLRATYARGIQIPTLIEYGSAQYLAGPVPSGLAFGGNPTLKPAVISNYELSYDRVLPSLNTTADAKVFFQQTEDAYGPGYLSAPSIAATATTSAEVRYENDSNSEMIGVELSASGKINGGFHWSADTTYTAVNDTVIDAYDLVARQTDFFKTTPKFRGNVAAGWSDAHWAADVYVHYVTSYKAYDPNDVFETTPSYISLAGRISYQFSKDLTVAFSGQNLTTERQVQGLASGLAAPRRILVSLSKSW